MTLHETLQKDTTEALKSGDTKRVAVLRFLLAQLQSKEIEKRGRGESPSLTNEETVAVLQREAKKRKEAIALYEQGSREDLAKKEKEELAVIDGYLPTAIGKEEIERLVDDLMKSGVTTFEAVMKAAMERLRGRADGKLVSEVVKKKLGK